MSFTSEAGIFLSHESWRGVKVSPYSSVQCRLQVFLDKQLQIVVKYLKLSKLHFVFSYWWRYFSMAWHHNMYVTLTYQKYIMLKVICHKPLKYTAWPKKYHLTTLSFDYDVQCSFMCENDSYATRTTHSQLESRNTPVLSFITVYLVSHNIYKPACIGLYSGHYAWWMLRFMHFPSWCAHHTGIESIWTNHTIWSFSTVPKSNLFMH